MRYFKGYTKRVFSCVMMIGFVFVGGDALLANNTGQAESPVYVSFGTDAAVPAESDASKPLLTFRGLLIDEDGNFFRITDQTSGKSYWVGLNEAGAPFVVRHYDNRRQVVTVEYKNRRIMLPLRMAKIAPVGPRQQKELGHANAANLERGGESRHEAVREEIRQQRGESESGAAPEVRDAESKDAK